MFFFSSSAKLKTIFVKKKKKEKDNVVCYKATAMCGILGMVDPLYGSLVDNYTLHFNSVMMIIVFH